MTAGQTLAEEVEAPEQEDRSILNDNNRLDLVHELETEDFEHAEDVLPRAKTPDSINVEFDAPLIGKKRGNIDLPGSISEERIPYERAGYWSAVGTMFAGATGGVLGLPKVGILSLVGAGAVGLGSYAFINKMDRFLYGNVGDLQKLDSEDEYGVAVDLLANSDRVEYSHAPSVMGSIEGDYVEPEDAVKAFEEEYEAAASDAEYWESESDPDVLDEEVYDFLENTGYSRGELRDSSLGAVFDDITDEELEDMADSFSEEKIEQAKPKLVLQTESVNNDEYKGVAYQLDLYDNGELRFGAKGITGDEDVLDAGTTLTHGTTNQLGSGPTLYDIREELIGYSGE